MDTSKISSVYGNLGMLSGVGGTQRIAARDSDGDRAGARTQGGRSGGGNALLGAVAQTLGQLGVNVSPPATAKAASQPTATGSPQGNGGAGDAKQALHAFMHDLFQATRNSASTGSVGVAAPAADKSYAGLANKLEGLAKQAGTQGANESLSKLKSSFDNLVKTLDSGATSGASATSATSGNTVNLQEFLQRLSQNLQGGALNPVGSLVSTAA